MGISPHGWREIAISAVAMGAAAAGLGALHPALAIPPILVFLVVLFFFRDPRRRAPDGENLVVSPADGRVADVERVLEDRYLGRPCLRVGIFLSIADVHVNRVPLDGVVRSVQRRTGKFYPAYHPRASKENEANDLHLYNEKLDVPVLVRQVTGVVARRIVCTAKVGDRLNRGDRFGLIKFGSRTEIYLPEDRVAELRVSPGMRVRGAESVVATLLPKRGAA